MYRGCTVAVVVPAYNEAGFVGEVIDTLPDVVDRAYVVDDASTDGTWAEVREHAAAANRAAGRDEVDGAATVGEVAGPARGGEAEPVGSSELRSVDGDDRRVVPIRHDENRGVGGAIATGYRRALDDGADVTAVMNGDGQMDPAVLDRVLDPVVTGEAGYAKGDRLTDAERRAPMSRFRLFGNALLTGLTRVATGYWGVTDPQNGYTAISRAALSAVDLEARYEDYGFCNDMLAALSAADVRVADVPMTAVYGDERSGIRYSRFVPRLSALLLAVFLRRLWRSHVVRELHPLVALYALGTVGLLAGAAGVAGGAVAAGVGAPVVGAAATFAGGLAGLLGAGLGSLGAACDRAAAGDRAVRVAVDGGEADGSGTERAGRDEPEETGSETNGSDADPANGGEGEARRTEVRADGTGGGRTGDDDAEPATDGDRAGADRDRRPGSAAGSGTDCDGDGPEVTGR